MVFLIIIITLTSFILFYNGYQDSAYILLPLYSNKELFNSFVKKKYFLMFPVIGEILGAVFLGKIVLTKILFGYIAISNDLKFNIILPIIIILSINMIIYLISSFLPFPVSLSHTIIGGLIGLGLFFKLNIYWNNIILATLIWTITPLAGMIISYLIYHLINLFYFKLLNSYKSIRLFSVFILLIFYSMTLFLIKKFANSFFFIVLIFYIVLFSFFIILIYSKEKDNENTDVSSYEKIEKIFSKMILFILPNIFLSHGANDVANSTSLIYLLFLSILPQYNSKYLLYIILIVGAIILSYGIIFKGTKKSIKLSQSIFQIDCSKSFSSFLSLFASVIIFSILGFRVSSVYTITGSYIGIGYAKGFSIFNSKLIIELLLSWIITFSISIFLSYFSLSFLAFLKVLI